MKKVTVIIPVYGAEKYIAATVQSVLEQTYENFELLLVDDGSPDRSIEVCQQFTDPRIRILRQENSGPAAARNLAIREATGDYIALLDADDLWRPTKLAQHIDHLEQSPEVGVSFCRSELIDDAGNSLGMYQVLSKLDNLTLLDLLCRTPIGNGSVPVFRRQVLDDIRYTARKGETEEVCYFNPDRTLHPSEDVECWVRIQLLTQWKIEGISDALTLYRIHSKGFSANLLKKLRSWEEMLRVINTYAPKQIAPYVAPAMAYQLRHLARRAVSLRDGAMATQLIHQALKTDASILKEEPSRTLQTLVAAYLVRSLPRTFYQLFEWFAMRAMGAAQKQRMSKEAVS